MDDTDRKEIKKIVKSLLCCTESDTGCDECVFQIYIPGCRDKLMTQAASMLKELLKFQPVKKWINVGEQLPAENEMVLVCCKSKAGFRNINRAYYMNGFWHGSGSMAGVTHWMPLPDLPDEEE